MHLVTNELFLYLGHLSTRGDVFIEKGELPVKCVELGMLLVSRDSGTRVNSCWHDSCTKVVRGNWTVDEYCAMGTNWFGLMDCVKSSH